MVCAKHWPENPQLIKGEKGKYWSQDPPTIFEELFSSKIPIAPPKPTSTKRSSFEIRTLQKDELLMYKTF